MSTSIRIFTLVLSGIICFSIPTDAQRPSPSGQPGQQARQVRPDPSIEVREVIDRIFNYIDGCTPAAIVDADGKVIKDEAKLDRDSRFQKGDFSIISYEWGVTYSALLLASEVTGDEKYARYVYDRFRFLGKVFPHVKRYYDETGYQMGLNALYRPRFLDDCGAMCASLIKATLANPRESMGFRPLLDNWFNFVMYKEYRLGDGILARRNRPLSNSVWLDDMYMGINPIAWRGRLSQIERGDLTQKFYNEAINQVMLFKNYLWEPELNLYRHGWIDSMEEHSSYYWARANGWAMLTMCEVLDALPEDFQGRDKVLNLLKSLIRGIAPLQSPDGRWHQLLDKTETYLETSASAMYVYSIAHAINQGWIDRIAYQDIAKSGWNGIAKQVNEKGQVENTCVGTGLGWTNIFYATRPLSVFAAHGYGPVLLASAEMLKLYAHQERSSAGGFPSWQNTIVPYPVQQATRKEGKPMLFLAGDSTCMNGDGSGSNGMWGWGNFFSEYFSPDLAVENDALGGLSSRTFFDSRWNVIRDRIQPGDYVIIQFGHNDMSPINSGRARGTLDGTGNNPQTFIMEKNGAPEEVYSYGHYIRMMVRQAKLRGGLPIVVSPTPQNNWNSDNSIRRFEDTFNAWCRQVAEEENVPFIDLNELAAREYDKIGKQKAQKDYFADGVHTRENGARLYCEVLSKAIKACPSTLSKYVK
ncbi:MAG: glycoside hydrolase family 88 protein [Candidatus Cryptobacteroides sp.]|jgi:unsaturated rhamnogalacturonyl hydrolase